MPLNKRQFLRGRFCPKALYLDFHVPQEAPDEVTRQRMDEGRQVGEWARAGFPGGVLVAAGSHEEAVRETRRLMADPGVSAIFEGAFERGGLRARADVLARNGDAWDLVEVKASVSAKAEHVEDAALTRHVAVSSGVEIASCRLRLLNRAFRLGMPLSSLFVDCDVTEEALFDPGETDGRVRALLSALDGPAPPEAPLGLHCRGCDHAGTCLREGHVLGLPNLREKRYAQLCAAGVSRIEEIPEGFSLTETQARVREAAVTGRPWAGPGLAQALKRAVYPLFFLDFESVQTAFPLYPDVAPYEQVPTQYSLHVLPAPGGGPEHREFLHESPTDPRRALAERLVADLEGEGSVVVYHRFERDRIEGLAGCFSDLAPALEGLVGRLYDLHAVINRHCYHPGFGGSFSLKRTLPALVPDLGYDDLGIADGSAASAAYREMIQPGTAPERRGQIARDLRAYCARDTLAMVRLHEALWRMASDAGGRG